MSDFTILPEDATNYPYPAVQTGSWIDSTCEYYNYVTDNTSLMNLVIGSNNELSNNQFETNDIKLFPNPFDKNDKFLNISFDSNNLKQIKIFDLMGRRVYHSEIIDNRIEISSLNAGTYIVEIKINDQVQRSKLIIK